MIKNFFKKILNNDTEKTDEAESLTVSENIGIQDFKEPAKKKKKNKGKSETEILEEKLESAAAEARSAKKEEMLKGADGIKCSQVGLPTEIRAAAAYLGISDPMILDEQYHGSNGSQLKFEDDSDSSRIAFKRSAGMIGEIYLSDTAFTRYDYNEFRARFETHRDISRSDEAFHLMLTDWLFFCRDSGYDADDYFDYEFYNKETAERMSFVGAVMRENLRRTLNKKPNVIGGKSAFLKKYCKYIKRDWIDIGECTFEEFSEFAKRNPVFYAKARKGSGGAGIRRINAENMSRGDLCEVFDQCKEDNCIAETAVVQHSSMAEFNSDTVNTVRIVTIAGDNEVCISGAAVRFGRKGGTTDNYHQGGVCALVDTDTGVIISDAIDRSGRHYSSHPDSEKAFEGFQIPFWNELSEYIKTVAAFGKHENRFIGWDTVITKDGSFDIIEGNSRPGFDILQAQDMKGRRAEYEEFVKGLVEVTELNDQTVGFWRRKKELDRIRHEMVR